MPSVVRRFLLGSRFGAGRRVMAAAAAPSGVHRDWLVIATAVLVGTTVVVFGDGLRGPAMAVTVVDDAVVGWLAQLRPEFTPLRVVAAMTSWWTILTLSYGTALALLILRRFRHLLVLIWCRASPGCW